MTTRRDAGRATGVVGLIIGMNIVIGFVGYFVVIASWFAWRLLPTIES